MDNEEEDPYRAANWTARNLISRKLPPWLYPLGIYCAYPSGMVVYIGGVLLEENWRDAPFIHGHSRFRSYTLCSDITAIPEARSQTPMVPNPFSNAMTGPP